MLISIIKIRVGNAPIFPQKQGFSQNNGVFSAKTGADVGKLGRCDHPRIDQTKTQFKWHLLIVVSVCLLSFIKGVKVYIFLKDV